MVDQVVGNRAAEQRAGQPRVCQGLGHGPAEASGAQPSSRVTMARQRLAQAWMSASSMGFTNGR